LTQTLGWVDAWVSKPSVYLVAGKQCRSHRGGGELRTGK
jgi:hypothetical protein